MRGHRSVGSGILAIMLAALAMTSSAGAAVDIVGSLSNSSGPNPFNAKGNAFRIDTSTVLNLQEFYLNFTGSHTLTFSVYSSPTEFGTYTRVQNNTVTRSSAGGGEFISSGPITVPLLAGTFYITAVEPLDSIIYYFGSGASQATSFGAQVHGFATGTSPMGPTISSTADDSAIYFQRLTTNIPEPAGVLSAAVAAAAAALMSRRSVAR